MSKHTPVGYVVESTTYCRDCAMDRYGFCENHGQWVCSNDDELKSSTAIFSWTESLCGETCDICRDNFVEHPDTGGKKCDECSRTYECGMLLEEPAKIEALRAENGGGLPSIMYPQVVAYMHRGGSITCDECASLPDPLDPVVDFLFITDEEDDDGFMNHTTCDQCSQTIDPACRLECQHESDMRMELTSAN